MVAATQAAEERLRALPGGATPYDAETAAGPKELLSIRVYVGGAADCGVKWQLRGVLGGWSFRPWWGATRIA